MDVETILIIIFNHSTTNLNNNSVYKFDRLYKNIINVTKYLITNSEYQMTKVK